MKLIKIISGIVSFMLIFYKPVYAQENTSLVFNYTSKNGLPQNTIIDMTMDSGYLWLCTEAGLVRFDGNQFKNFQRVGNTHIANLNFKLIIRTQGGEKFFYESGGDLLKIQANKIISIAPVVNRTESYLLMDGAINSLDLFRNVVVPNYIQLKSIYGERPIFIPQDHGDFLIGGQNHLNYCSKGEKPIEIYIKNKQINDLFVFQNHTYLTDTKNNLYQFNVATKKFNQVYFSGDLLKQANEQSSNKLKVFWEFGHKIPVVLRRGQLFLIKNMDAEGNLETELFGGDVPQNTSITNVIFDEKSNKIYVGTDSKGLFVYRRKKIFSRLNTLNDVGKNNVYYALVSPDSNTVITSYGRVFTEQGAIGHIPELQNMFRESFVIDNRNRLWFSTRDNIQYFDLKSKKRFALNSHFASTFYPEGDSVWIGGPSFIGFVYQDSFHLVLYLDKFLHENPENLIRGPDGNIWFASPKGIFKLESTLNGTKAVCLLNNVSARYLWAKGEMVYVATQGNGFFVYHNGRFIQMPVDEKNFLAITHSFQIDKRNKLWISTNHGLFSIPVSEIKQFLQDTSMRLYYSYYGEDEGLRSSEFNGGCYPSSLVLRNGIFVFPSMDGLVFFDPVQLAQDHTYGAIFLDEVKVDQILKDINQPMVVEPSAENILFTLSIPYFGQLENLHLEYKLLGYNKYWIKMPVGNYDIRFSNIPAGKYELQVRMKLDSGWKTFSPISFMVQKKFYQNTWFMLTVLIAVLLIFYLLVKYYYSSLSRKNIRLEGRINEATKELRALNKTLQGNVEKLKESEKGLQQSVNLKNKLISIISHEIITPLSFISLVARKALGSNDQPLQEILSDIRGTSEKLYFSAQNTLNWIKYQNFQIAVKKVNIALNPLVEELFELNQEYADNKGSVFENLIPLDDILKTDKNILLIILNNLVANAIKYCPASTIRISAEKGEGKYGLFISDNGPGIPDPIMQRIHLIKEKKEIELPDQAANQNGLGYIIIFELVNLIDAHIEIESNSGKGTCVKIWLDI